MNVVSCHAICLEIVQCGFFRERWGRYKMI